MRTIAAKLGLKSGYRVVTNCGRDAGQEVMHLHFHMLAGRRLRLAAGVIVSASTATLQCREIFCQIPTALKPGHGHDAIWSFFATEREPKPGGLRL